MESPGVGEGDRPAGFADGYFYQLLGLFLALDAIQQAGDISLSLLAGGLKVSFISVMYGMLIYAASLVIRMLQKPKI